MQNKYTKLHYWEQLSCLMVPAELPRNLRRCNTLDRVYLGKDFPDIYWTRREAECVYYLMHNPRFEFNLK